MNGIVMCYGAAMLVAASELVTLQLLVRRQSPYHSLFFSALLLASCGYFAESVSTVVEEAVLAVKLTYISIFLPLFVLLAIAEFCKTHIPRGITYALVGANILDMVFACTIGYSPLYYTSYALGSWNGVSYLFRVYGPLHVFHYVVLFVEMLLVGFIILRTFYAKKNVSRPSVLMLLVGFLGTLLVYYLEHKLRMPVEVIPFVYAGCGVIYLALATRLQVYDVTHMLVSTHERKQDYGYIFFDRKLRLMNFNQTAETYFPELAKAQIGVRLYVHNAMTVYITSWLEEIYRDNLPLPQRKNISHGDREIRCKADVLPGVGTQSGGYVVELFDDTRQQEYIRAIMEEKERADEANAAKTDFLSNMSHEMRTPMNVIVGMTDVLLREKQTPQNKEYLLSIKNSSHALIELMDDILDFSNVELGKLELVEGEYDLLELLGDLGMFFLTRIDVKDVELLYDIDPKLPAKLYGDSTRIRQIIINLMNNAIKYTNHGQIWLTVSLLSIDGDDVNLHFSVRDTGIGIHREDQRKLFTAFQQVDSKKVREAHGAGLGLALTKGLVSLMHGEISLKSRYGEGSEFFFNIHQKLVDGSVRCTIRSEEPETRTVAGMLSDPQVKECLEKLTAQYGLAYRTCGELGEGEELPDYLFSDLEGYHQIPEEKIALLKEHGTTICILRNPIMEAVSEKDRDAIVLNKPLYSWNFCQVIDHAFEEEGDAEEQMIHYRLPDAKVLIVDDTEINLVVAKMLLEPLEMEIDTATNGREALRLIARKKYDLILMDHMMPVMDGVEATKALRAMDDDYCRQVPVIALTANVIADARAQYKAAGMNDMVSKPVTASAIRRCIFKWMPKELIQRADGPEEIDHSDEQIELPGELADLDIAAGVENSGSRKMFLRLLGDFYQLIDTKTKKIEECIRNEMIHDYTIEVHALKNSARMIGALKLSNLFLKCEQYAHAENKEAIRELNPIVMEKFKSYKSVLAPYGRANDMEKREIPKEKLAAVIARIKTAMDGFDLDGADEAMKELEGIRMPEDIAADYETLRVAISDVAMEEVLSVCDTILEKLG